MPVEYLQVAEDYGEEPIELPVEEDGSLLLSTLQAQFPSACGLKYRNPENRTVTRGIRSNEGRLYPPSTERGFDWGSKIYFCVFPKNKRKNDDDNLENNTAAKTKRIEKIRLHCSDLIVLGLPWKTSDESLRKNFEKFGNVLMAQVKKDINSGQSKGFGFIRFDSYEAQMRVLAKRQYLIDGRWCEVKVPNSKQGGTVDEVSCKVFVARCTEDLTADDLREYFSKFGEVTDVFIPEPFRGFGFVTFLEPEIAQSLCGEDYIIKGVSVHVTHAAPKQESYRYTSKNNKPNVNQYNNQNYVNLNTPNIQALGINPQRNNLSNQGHNPLNQEHDPSNQGYNPSNQGHNPSNQHQNLSNQGHNPSNQIQNLSYQRQNPSNQGQHMNIPFGVGLNLNTLRMNTAIVSAALNQWSVILQNQNQDQDFGTSAADPNLQPSGNSSQQGDGFLSRMFFQGRDGGESQQRSNQPVLRQPTGSATLSHDQTDNSYSNFLQKKNN